MKKILVVGDIMLDIYHFGKVNRISPEAPIPVFIDEGELKKVPGGAANVAANIVAAGADADILSCVGNDEGGRDLLDIMSQNGIGCHFVKNIRGRYTTQKIRFIAQNNQQIMRSDKETTEAVAMEELSDAIRDIESNIGSYGVILFSDYKKGLLSKDLCEILSEIGRYYDIPVFYDVKDTDISKYKNATILKPNRKELSDLTGLPTETIDEAIHAAKELCKETECGYVLATLGADGMILVNNDGLISSVKSAAKEVYDVTGAGDTSVAYLAVEVLRGNTIENAMYVANVAAGIQVGKVGTSAVKAEEVDEAIRINDLNGHINKKEKVVFTNGCFDILHAGHIDYLKKARALGDRLIVGLNSDASVKRLKGDQRPINTLMDRKLVLESLSFVDEVIPFEEDTPIELIKKVRPDVLVKGGDYDPDEIVGAAEVRAWGGTVMTLPFVEGQSTTSIIEKLEK